MRDAELGVVLHRSFREDAPRHNKIVCLLYVVADDRQNGARRIGHGLQRRAETEKRMRVHPVDAADALVASEREPQDIGIEPVGRQKVLGRKEHDSLHRPRILCMW